MPQAPPGDFAQVQLAFGQGSEDMCLPGTSDGLGNVVVGTQRLTYSRSQLDFYDSKASRRLGSAYLPDFAIFGQLDGYIGNAIAGASASSVYALAPDGSTRRRQDFSAPGWGAEDPLGGLVEWVAGAAGSWEGTTSQLVAFEANGAQRWRVPVVGSGPFAAIGVDRAGDILVLFQAGHDAKSFSGVWFSHDGVQRGPAFQAYQSANAYSNLGLVPRLGNGFFLQSRGDAALLVPPVHGAWLASYEPFADRPGPVPDWLAVHPDSLLHPVRGGAGYALIPMGGQQVSPCAQTIAILAPDGTPCAQARFPVDAQSCTTAQLSVGYDGTVLQVRPVSREYCTPDGGHCNCTWHFWSGYFR